MTEFVFASPVLTDHQPIKAGFHSIATVLATLLAGNATHAQNSNAFEPSLFRTPIRIEMETARAAEIPVFPAEWHLPQRFVGSLAQETRLRGVSDGLSTELAARLRIPAGADGTGVIVPDAGLLDRFSAAEREAWAGILSEDPRNVTYRWPLAVKPEVLSALEQQPAMREAVSRFRRWSDLSQGVLIFRDVFALEGAFPSAADRSRFFQAVTGSDALLVKLQIPEGGTPKDSEIDYWHSHGHYRAIRPFLAALSSIEGHDRLDLTHVLPPDPKFLLNTFPGDPGRDTGPGMDSAWISARFFANAAEGDMDLSGGFNAWLQRACEPIAGPPKFGDVFVYDDPESIEWPYSVVYIADGIVFGRRPTAFGPWQLMSLEDVGRLNPRLGSNPRRYRTKEFSMPAEVDAASELGRTPSVFIDGLALRQVKDGPWGRLYFYQVLLAPSGELLKRIPEPPAEPEWKFRDLTSAAILDGIRSMNMQPATRDALFRLFEGVTPGPDGVLTVHPSTDLVFATPKVFRDRFFPQMAFPDDGTGYLSKITAPTTETADEWFSEDLIPSELRPAFLQLTYRSNGGIGMADFGAAYHLAEDPTDRLAILQSLYRTPGLVVLLAKPQPQDIPALAAYWGESGLRNVRPILESFAASPDTRFLDIIELLPGMPRQLMNMFFPAVTDEPTPNCVWTSLNFDALRPDNRFLLMPNGDIDQARQAWQELEANYTKVTGAARLGDVIVYHPRGQRDQITHMCVFVADGIVYTKNGFGSTEPWCLQQQSDVEALYMNDGMEREFFRPKTTR